MEVLRCPSRPSHPLPALPPPAPRWNSHDAKLDDQRRPDFHGDSSSWKGEVDLPKEEGSEMANDDGGGSSSSPSGEAAENKEVVLVDRYPKYKQLLRALKALARLCRSSSCTTRN